MPSRTIRCCCFSQALHFSLVDLFSTYEAMVCHNRLVRATDKLRTSTNQLVEKTKELELQVANAEGKVAEFDSKLQAMDLKENEQLAEALAASKENLAYVVKTTKDEGCNEATTAANVPINSELRKNDSYPCPKATDHQNTAKGVETGSI
ncbi:hypothetical protein CsSME_00052567 [Camellia sinensis var. sinensis]